MNWKRREADLGLVLQLKRVLPEEHLSLKLMLSGGGMLQHHLLINGANGSVGS